MISGVSSPRGIMFRDSAAKGDNAVYCWREDGAVQTLAGPTKDIEELFRREKNAAKLPEAESRLTCTMGVVMVVCIAIVSAPFALGWDAVLSAGIVAACVVGCFPAIALARMFVRLYPDDLEAQLRRNHGAEHAALACHRRKASLSNLDELRASSWLDPECGTVYLSSVLLWGIVLGACIVWAPHLGVFWAVCIAVLAAALLVLNIWFNPRNPLKAIQRAMTAQPGDDELFLAAAGLSELLRITHAEEEPEASAR